jgi:hypothetical protein
VLEAFGKEKHIHVRNVTRVTGKTQRMFVNSFDVAQPASGEWRMEYKNTSS